MSAYLANVKVEQLAEGGSARTPGSIVASSTTSGNRAASPQPQPPGREPLRAAAPRRLRRRHSPWAAERSEQRGGAGGTPCKLVQGAAPGRGILE